MYEFHNLIFKCFFFIIRNLRVTYFSTFESFALLWLKWADLVVDEDTLKWLLLVVTYRISKFQYLLWKYILRIIS